MKKVIVAAVAAVASTSSAYAADLITKARPVVAAPPPAFDIAFGSGIASEYIFRGITQSNHKPSVNAYFEPRYNINPNLQLYTGIAGYSISFPNRAAAEVDIYGGIRPTFGPVAFDLGVQYYWYPGGQCFSPLCGTAPLPNGNTVKQDFSFTEVYGKAAWTVVDPLVIGASVNYTSNILNTGAAGTYLSGTAKYTFAALPNGIAPYISGELARQWLGTSDAFYGSVKLPSYTTWNIGVGWTYKVFTVDLRYTDTDLSKGECNLFTGDHTAVFTGNTTIGNNGNSSNWCGPRFLAKLSADLTLNTNIK